MIVDLFLAVPAELKALVQWIIWRYIVRDGKRTKPPLDPHTGRDGNSTDPAKWTTFENALVAWEAKRGGAAGIGFVFAKDGDFVGVDLDHCRNPETAVLEPWAQEIVDRFRATGAYIEISPSGCGVHIIVRGRIPGPRRRDGSVEMYQDGRYFTVTGIPVGEPPKEIGDGQAALDWLYAKTFPNEQNSQQTRATHVDLDDAALIEKAKAAKNGAAFAALMAGDTSAYKDDDSAADLALLLHLAFWTGRDADRMDRIFRTSGLMREKWSRADYRARTIQKAIETTHEVYSGNGHHKAKSAQRPKPGDDTLEDPHLSDTGNSEIFALMFHDSMRYVDEWRSQLAFDEIRWKKNGKPEWYAGAEEVIRELHRRAANGPWQKRQDVARWALKSEGKERISGMIELAKWKLIATSDKFDTHPHLLNFKNVTVDLRTGEQREHDPADFLTQVVPFDYISDAKCPRWEQFVSEIFERKEAMVRYLHRLLGYSISGETREQIQPIAWGSGGNGKNVLFDTLTHVLGPDYSGEAAPDLLLANRRDGHPTALADLHGKRVVVASETEAKKKLAEALVKMVTGNRTLKARFMRADYFEFKQSAKVYLHTNHKPDISADDDAIWDRVRLIPFTVRFRGTEREDKHLVDKLRAEAEGILRWLVDGACAWYSKGLETPSEVLTATGEFRAECDQLAEFISDCCVTGNTQFKARAADLHQAFVAWHGLNIGGEYMTKTEFGLALGKKGFIKDKVGVVWWCGIGLREQREPGEEG